MKSIVYTKGNDIIIRKGSYYLDYKSDGKVKILELSCGDLIDTIQDYDYTYNIGNINKMDLEANVYFRVQDAFNSYIRLDNLKMFLESIEIGEYIYSSKYQIVSSYGDLQVQNSNSYLWDWTERVDVITPKLEEKFKELKDNQTRAVKRAENLLKADKMVYKNKIKIIQTLKTLKHGNETVRVISC